MKRIARLLCVLFFVNFPFLLPAANTQKSDPEVSQAKKIEKKPKPIPIKPAPEKAKKAPTLLPPRATGIIPEGIRQGPQLINPLAPKEMGYGQRFMAKDPRQPHPTWTINSTEVMTPGGGLELFTWEW